VDALLSVNHLAAAALRLRSPEKMIDRSPEFDRVVLFWSQPINGLRLSRFCFA
jgi:hypothetical protein